MTTTTFLTTFPSLRGEEDRRRRNTTACHERIITAALPTILQIAEPFDNPEPHPYFTLEQAQSATVNLTSPRTAYQFFCDTVKIQLATRDGKLEVVQGHHEGPIDVAPLSRRDLRKLGFCDLDEIPSFPATNVFLRGSYESGGPRRLGQWFSATGPDLGENGAICAIAEPGAGDFCHLMDNLKVLSSFRNANLDSDCRILPLKGACAILHPPLYIVED